MKRICTKLSKDNANFNAPVDHGKEVLSCPTLVRRRDNDVIVRFGVIHQGGE